jgi:hypothetical protein
MPAADRFASCPGEPDHAARLVQLVRSDPWIMELLRAVQSLGLADWCLAAGVVRNLVWDHLHGHPDRTAPGDIDVLFFDRARTDPAYEAEVERRLSAIVPAVRWEAVNQAAVHSYTRDPPYGSIAEAMSRWADPVTAVGVRLTASDEIAVLAPHGLSDLFALTVRPNLAAPDAARVYHERMTQKRRKERWPKLTILWPQAMT